MPITPNEAAMILGDNPGHIREMQAEGLLPDPIPDDYFDSVIAFRVKLEKVLRRKIDRQRGVLDDED